MSDRSNLKQASARGVVWNVVQNLASRLLALVVVAILSRILDRSAFGVVALALVVNSFAELIINQGFGEFITQSPELTDQHLDTAFWLNAGLGLVSTGLVALAATPLSEIFADASIAPIVRWLSLSLVIRSLSVVPTGILVRQLKFRSLSLRGLIAAVASGVVGIGAAIMGFGIYSLVIQVIAGDIASTLMLWRATHWSPGRRVSRACLKDLTSFGAPVIGAQILGLVSRRFDTFFVAGALDMATLGIYSMAQRVFQIVLQVLNKSMADVTFSALARLGDDRRDTFYKVIELTAVLSFPVYVGIAIIAGPLTLTLFGARWAPSANPMALFALSGVPFSLTLVHISTIKSIAQTRLMFIIQVIFLCGYLPLMVVMVQHGASAAAGANLIACTAIIPVEVVLIAIAMPMSWVAYAKSLVGPILATTVMAGVTIAVAVATRGRPPWLRLAAEGIAGGSAYIAALRSLAPTSFKRCYDLVRSTIRPRQ
jgi:PST family polysaccharide transporter